MVGTVGIEPTTCRISDDCSATGLRPIGRGGEIRTPDALCVGQALLPLSYTPMVRLPGFEPGTSGLGDLRSFH